MTENRLTVKLDEIIGTIHPNIYGHFIEHLGRCIYPGIWVGKDSKIPNIEGLRKDVVEALKAQEISGLAVQTYGGAVKTITNSAQTSL